MENTCRDIIVYTGEQEAIPIVVTAPGHHKNAIQVENAPDLHQVHGQFGLIENPILRRSRCTRYLDSPAPSSSTPLAKRQKGLASPPFSLDNDDEDNVPLSQFLPKTGRTSRSATTPHFSTAPTAEIPIPPTVEMDASIPDPIVDKSVSPSPDPVAANPSPPLPEPPLGEGNDSTDDADFVPTESESDSESSSATDSNPEPPPLTHPTPSSH